MPQETSSTEVWETRKAKALRLAHRRLLVSVPLLFISVGVRQGLHVSTTAAVWSQWFVSAALAILACTFAAEVVFRIRAFEKVDDISLVSAAARAVMWLAIFWIGYLAVDVCLKIAPVSL